MPVPQALLIRINPAFRRHPDEAVIIGRLVVAFGELEFAVCRNAGLALNLLETVLTALYKQRVTASRLDTADALMRPIYKSQGLLELHDATMCGVRHCLKIRNQFAHCNWADDAAIPGLYFADLQTSADSPLGTFEHSFRHIDVPLLNEHELFFSNTLEWLDFLSHELKLKYGSLIHHNWPRPSELAPPPLHNPPEKHVPTWLDEAQIAFHLARAAASQGGAPTPTPEQQALDKARAEKKAKREESIRKAREGDQHSKSRSADDTEK